jgi:ABC-type uncharacterized transport system auxiliary subunit
MTRRLLLLLGCLLLAACFTSGRRGGDTAMAVYDLGPVAGEQVVLSRTRSMALEVRMPLWFDAFGINYRLSYAEPARLREYARARWAGPPAQLIQQSLRRDLGLQPAGQGRALCLLRVDIDEFSQVFASPSQSHGVLQGRVQWLDCSRTSLAERSIDIQVPVVNQDSAGGVAALTSAVAALTQQVRAAESELLASGRLKSCQS